MRLYRIALTEVPQFQFMWGPCLLSLASLAEQLSQPELATRLLGVAEIVDQTVYPLYPFERDDCNRLADAARVRLGTETFDIVWLQGRDRPFGEVVEEAVATLETVLGVGDDGAAIGVFSGR
jgi:hypothetical protein